MSKVLTVGTFDLYHAGHVNFLYQCAIIAGIYTHFGLFEANYRGDDKHFLVVGINTDEFVEKFKGKKPLYSYEQRTELINSNKHVNYTLKNDSANLKEMLERVKPNILIVGSDWATKDYYAQIGVTQEWLDQKGITLCYVPYTQGVSTSQLKERIIGS